jgi:hypothetical protein
LTKSAAAVEIEKLSRFDLKRDAKVLAIGPSKQEVIVGGHNILRLLKIEPDLSIRSLGRNFGVSKQAGGQAGATEIKWNQRQPNMVITSKI